MPSKKVQHTSDSEPVEEGTHMEARSESLVCGHVNKQFYNSAGRLEDLQCDFEKGHGGDHHARYARNIGVPEYDEKNRLVKVNYFQEEADAWWSDAAGVPANVMEVEAEQMSLFQKDLVMQVLKKSPEMPIALAITAARKSPEWNSLNEPG